MFFLVPETDSSIVFLFQSVATIGSTVTSVQHDVKTMQDALENQKKDDDMKKTMVILSPRHLSQFIILNLEQPAVNTSGEFQPSSSEWCSNMGQVDSFLNALKLFPLQNESQNEELWKWFSFRNWSVLLSI